MIKILCVDDDSDLLSLIGYMFELEGFEVHTANSAKKALAILGETLIDVVLSDVRMPLESGVDLLKQIQRLKGVKRPRVFLMTGFSEYRESEIVALGGEALFVKPLDMTELVKKVAQQLRPNT